MTKEEESLLKIAEENNFINAQQRQEVQLFVETLDTPGGVLAVLQDKGYINKESKREIKEVYKILKDLDGGSPNAPIEVAKIKKAIQVKQTQSASSVEILPTNTPTSRLDINAKREEEEDSDFGIQSALPTTAPKVDLAGPISLKQTDSIRKGENRPIEIEGYNLLKVAGRGNQAVVFKAQDLKTNKIVAVKILNPNLANETRFERFFKEAKLLNKFDHPNIAKGFDFGESNGYNYFVMEYLKGETAKEHVENKGVMSTKLVLTIAEQITYALIYANSIKLVHRDIKPDNIMIVGDFKQIKLCDLGLAKALEGDKQLTQVGQVVGTPNYISPEIAKGETPDIRSDIYALGATLYFLVIGTPPFNGENATAVMRKHIFEDLVPPIERDKSIEPHLSELITNMMEKNPIDRPQTPENLLAKIERVRNQKSAANLSNFANEDIETESSDSFLVIKDNKKDNKKPESSDDLLIPQENKSEFEKPKKTTPLPIRKAKKKTPPPPPKNTKELLDLSKEEREEFGSLSPKNEELIPQEEDLFSELPADDLFKKDVEEEEYLSPKQKKKKKKEENELYDEFEDNLQIKMFEDEFKCRSCSTLFPRTRFICPHCYQLYCVYCRRRLKEDPLHCRKCGRQQPAAQRTAQIEQSEEMPAWGWALIAVVAVLIVAFFIYQQVN